MKKDALKNLQNFRQQSYRIRCIAEARTVIESMEHRRWNAYMRSEGYIFSDSTDQSSRNDLGKMHNELTDYYSLTEEEKRKDSAAGLD